MANCVHESNELLLGLALAGRTLFNFKVMKNAMVNRAGNKGAMRSCCCSC